MDTTPVRSRGPSLPVATRTPHTDIRNSTRRVTLRVLWWLIAIGLLVTVRIQFHAIVDILSATGTFLVAASKRWLLIALAATVASVWVSALVRRRTLHAGGGHVTLREAASAGFASGAVQMTIPAGGVVATGFLFRRFTTLGLAPASVTWSLAITGAVTTAFVTAMATLGIALGSSASTIGLLPGLVGAALVVAGCFWAVRNSMTAARWCGKAMTGVNRVLRRPADTGVARVQAAVRGLGEVRPRLSDWVVTCVGTAASLLAGALCLWASITAAGIAVPPQSLLTYFALAMAGSSLALLPAGLGVVDGILLAWLATAPGVTGSAALGAVLLYRVASAGAVIAAGWAGIALRHARRNRTRPGPLPGDEQPPMRTAKSQVRYQRAIGDGQQDSYSNHASTGQRGFLTGCHAALCADGECSSEDAAARP